VFMKLAGHGGVHFPPGGGWLLLRLCMGRSWILFDLSGKTAVVTGAAAGSGS
jgi:hypothetical protein